MAVDEVLRRLANEPGVLPVRLSWKDSLVRPDVQRFTKASYDNVLAAGARTPATSKLVDWHARHRRASDERDALADWLRAVDERDAAAAELQAVRSERRATQARHDEGRRVLAGRLAAARADVESLSRGLARLRGEDAALTAQLAELEPARRAVGRLLDRLGVGKVARLRVARDDLGRHLAAAATAFHNGGRRYEAERRYHEAEVSRLAALDDEADAGVVAAEARAARATGGVERTAGTVASRGFAHTPLDRRTAAARVATLDGEREGLAARIDVQRRWFELVGTTGDEDADRRRGREVVGRALRSAVNLVCSTTTGFGGDRDYRDLDYDTLVVDEASKVTAAEFLVPAIRARRWVLVGDEKQLPPHVDQRDEHHVHALATDQRPGCGAEAPQV